MPAEPVPVRWLRRVFAHTEDGWVTVFGIAEGQRHTHWAKVDELEQMSAALAALAPSADLWFGVATRATQLLGSRRGGDVDCLAVPALWLDIDVAHDVHNSADLPVDYAEARSILEDFPLPPTAIVDSGHGLQVWWQFTEPVPAVEATPLLARWAATWADHAERRHWHLDNVFDLARIMRLPGTTNRKAEPVPVRLLEADWTRTYGADDIDQFLVDPQPQPQPQGDKTPYIGPQRPGDAFNATKTGQDVLAAAGWVFGRRDATGDEHWVRPGKVVRQGTGATVYAEDGHTTIWTDATGLPVRRPMDPFGLHTHIHHGGDWRASSEKLARQGYGQCNRSDDDLSWVAGGAPSKAVECERHGWERVDLAPFLDGTYTPVLPTLWPRDDGQGLFYPARVNDLHGPSGEGKSFVAQAVLATELIAGQVVAMIDFEDHAPAVINRLLSLGVPTDALRHRFIYRHPDQRASIEALAEIEADVTDSGASVVLIDSTGESMALEHLNQDKDPEVVAWANMLPRRFSRRGAGVILIDHVTKDVETRGLHAIGSQRKMGMIDGVTYRVDQVRRFARGVSGLVKLVCAKDRNGTYPRGATAAEIAIDSTVFSDGSEALSLTPRAVTPIGDQGSIGGIQRTVLAERISKWLEIQAEPQSQKSIIKAVQGKEFTLILALDELVAAGYVETISGSTRAGSGHRNVVLHGVAKPFREDDLDHLVEEPQTPPENGPRTPTDAPTDAHETAGQSHRRPTDAPQTPQNGTVPTPRDAPTPPTGGRTGVGPDASIISLDALFDEEDA